MADVLGNRIRLTLFGESHGPIVGVVIDGLPAGVQISLGAVADEMRRRAPGVCPLLTSRQESDTVEILSGFYGGKTTGSALCGIIRNQDVRSGDYGTIPRPGHGDLTAAVKYGGYADMRGGGHFSGRLTAPLVFAGAVAKQMLALQGISVFGRMLSVGTVVDDSLSTLDEGEWMAVSKKDFRVADDHAGEAMLELISCCREEDDSVGGRVEVAAFGVPAGIGEPFFHSVESVVSHLFFSIPAVKAVEFGDGFSLSEMRGSAANDAIVVEKGVMTTLTNRCGGVLGGITTGRAVVARVAFKPTPSIAKAQDSIDPGSMEPVVLKTKGRHDPCVAVRGLAAVEAALALSLLDLMPEMGTM